MSAREWLALVVILGAFPQTGEGAQLLVPEEYPSILTAVDAAFPGDSVLVAPGTWTHRETRIVHLGDVDQTVTSCGFLKAPLAVIGTGGAEVTIVDAGGIGPGFVDTFLLANDAAGDVILEGMTITGAGNNAAAVIGIDSDRIVIKSCKVNGNDVGLHGRAVQAIGCDLAIFDSEVSFNESGNIAGVALVDQADLEIRRTRIEGNIGTGLYAAWSFPGPVVIITDCEFIGNRGQQHGGGAAIGSTIPVVIERNLFLANVAMFGFPAGGGLLLGNVSGSVRFNTFAYDTSEESSGGIAVLQAQLPLTISSNTFVGCHAPLGGAALGVSNVASAFEFSNNIVSLSTGGDAVQNLSSQLLQGGCNDYWQNGEGNFGFGWQPQVFDFFLDPQFCDADVLDLTVRESSPCAPKVNIVCGQVGAWGVGCGTISVKEFTWGKIKSLYR